MKKRGVFAHLIELGEDDLSKLWIPLGMGKASAKQHVAELRAAIRVLKACDKFRFGSNDKLGAILTAILNARRIAGKRP